MKRKLTSLFLATAMVMTTLAGCGNSGGKTAAKVDTSEAAQGKVLNIYCWNQEFQERFEYFKKSGKLPSDVKVNFVVTPNENNAYQNALDAALLKQKDAPADEKVDIFLVEADYALKYVDTDYTMAVSDLGITPNNDGKVIRLIFPELTEDRRKELAKEVKKKGDNAKVAIRNVRRDANDLFKKQNKAGEISDDELKGTEDDIQKLTDKYVGIIDATVEEKTKEILTV